MKKVVRVGNAGGYWGDDLDALYRQLQGGKLDYVTLDFLAEITMSILQKQRSRNPDLGYATDFVEQMRTCLPALGRPRTRIISNAGGINPLGCARQIEKMAHQSGLQIRIGVVSGDDLMERLDELLEKGIPLRNLETGQDLEEIRNRVESANAYLGAEPVIRALQEGAELIVTGRVTDTGITVAPPAFEFGWSLQDWDRLAAAVMAGHILECGAQATGGNLTDWRDVPSFLNMGYPIAEFLPDGTFVVTQHPGSGGQVTRKTVTEQLVYEMGDPRNYITPDVIADFSTLTLAEAGPNRVQVSGARGGPRPEHLKVSIAYQDGYKAHGTLIVSRPEAVDKCRALADILWKQLALDCEETSTELVGYNACHRRLVPSFDPPEILLRLGVRDHDRAKVEEFAKKFTSLLLSATPAVAIVGSRPRVQDVVAYWPCLVPASEITPEVTILDTGKSYRIPWTPLDSTGAGSNEQGRPAGPATGPPPLDRTQQPAPAAGRLSPGISHTPTVRVPLLRLCYGRSGDKGDTCNIGLVARSRETYAWLCRELTASRVKEYFGDICRGEVERFEVPNLLALNFLLHHSLGGGGTVSLRIDPQGKTLAAALLMMQVEVAEDWVHEIPNLAH